MPKAPIPEYARAMTWAEIRRREPLYVLIRWEFYVGLAGFVLFAAYFPWEWVANWAMVQAFVSVMEIVVPSIEGLDPAYRHLPMPASKAQLAFLHFMGVATLVCKMVMQKATVWREGSLWRFYLFSGGMAVLSLYYAYFLFFWDGTFYSEPGLWHGSRLQVVSAHTVAWLILIGTWSLVLSAVRKVVRRNRARRSGQTTGAVNNV